jgi:hypothetical protein
VGHHLIAQALPQYMLQQSGPVLGERGGVEAQLDPVHVEEPAEQQMVV